MSLDISLWSALHQERLNGSGYPFGYEADELPLGARIIALADVFTALTENRPYRKGMKKGEVTSLLMDMNDKNELDKRLVHILLSDYDAFGAVREKAQTQASTDYHAFRKSLRGG